MRHDASCTSTVKIRADYAQWDKTHNASLRVAGQLRRVRSRYKIERGGVGEGKIHLTEFEIQRAENSVSGVGIKIPRLEHVTAPRDNDIVRVISVIRNRSRLDNRSPSASRQQLIRKKQKSEPSVDVKWKQRSRWERE